MNRIRLFLLALGLALLAYLTLPTAVFADGLGDPAGQVKLDDTLASVHLSAPLVAMIISSIIPILVGLVTKLSTSSGVKWLLNLILNTANGLLVTATLADGTAVISQQAALTALLGVIMSAVAYKGWRSIGVTSSAVALPSPTEPGHTINVPGKLAGVGVK